jgi:hypothetical protein
VTKIFRVNGLIGPGIITPAHVIKNQSTYAFFQRHGGDSLTDLFITWRDKAFSQTWTVDITAGMFISLAHLHNLVRCLNTLV